MFGRRGPRTIEEKFRDFLRYGFGVRYSDYQRMDKELQAALNEKFAFVFLRTPLEDRVRQFLATPIRRPYCHAPGCEWREGEFTAFDIAVRYCVRCEHSQIRPLSGAGGWQDVSRNDYEFLFEQDTAHRAQWDAAVDRSAFNPYEMPFPNPVSATNGESIESSSSNLALARNDPSRY